MLLIGWAALSSRLRKDRLDKWSANKNTGRIMLAVIDVALVLHRNKGFKKVHKNNGKALKNCNNQEGCLSEDIYAC